MALFGTNGIRGILGEDLRLEDMHDITMAVASHISRGPILVGYDGRDTSGPISSTVISALCCAGLDCADAGLLPTPCLETAVRDLGYAGGIMVTASHNPPEYGGIKLVWSDGIEASRDDENAIERIHASRSWSTPDAWGKVSSETRAVSAYEQSVLGCVNAARLAKSSLRVVLDMGNGAQSAAAERIISKLCDSVTCIHDSIDATFPGRGPEPLPDNLGALSEAVRDTKSDIGIAFDGDGDRSMMCDERGSILRGDVSALFLADYLLDKHGASDIVTPLNSSDAIDDIVAKTRSRITRTKVGSVIVSRKMAEIGALAGFEENGGFLYGRRLAVRDGCTTAALALDALDLYGRPLSAVISELPESHTGKTRIECGSEEAAAAIRTLAREHPDADLTDGIKVRLGARRWVMARPSGTEPIIRVYAEADSQDGVSALLDEYTDAIRDALKA